MQISATTWKTYKEKMAKISQTAAEKMQTWIDLHGFSNKKALAEYAEALVARYGAASGALACEMYDATATAQGVTVAAAEIADIPEKNDISKELFTTLAKSKRLVSEVPGRLVKQIGADTMLKNAKRDGAEYAWIPSGDACAFCSVLASRGWQHISKAALKNGHAPHIHMHCRCQYAVRFDGKSSVQGYNPDKCLEEYDNAKGRTAKEKMNFMRRERYQKEKDVINARKRELYAEKKKEQA